MFVEQQSCQRSFRKLNRKIPPLETEQLWQICKHFLILLRDYKWSTSVTIAPKANHPHSTREILGFNNWSENGPSSCAGSVGSTTFSICSAEERVLPSQPAAAVVLKIQQEEQQEEHSIREEEEIALPDDDDDDEKEEEGELSMAEWKEWKTFTMLRLL